MGLDPDFAQTYMGNAVAMEMLNNVAATHGVLSGVEQASPRHGYTNLDLLGAAAYGHVDADDGEGEEDPIPFWRGARRELLEEMGLCVPFNWIYDESIVKHFKADEIQRPTLRNGRGDQQAILFHFTIVVPEGYACVEKTTGETVFHPSDEGDEGAGAIRMTENRVCTRYISIELVEL